MKTALYSAVLSVLLLLTVGCQSSSTTLTDDIAGRVLIWHTFNPQEEAVFDAMLENFAELHPDVRLTDERFTLEELETVFPEQAGSGLGPDIVILPASHINVLAADGLIRDISDAIGENGTLDETRFLTNALDMVRDGERIFGVPLSLSTFGLYYNKTLLGAADASAEEAAALITAQREQITDTAAIDAFNAVLTNFENAAIPPASDLEQLLRQANAGQRVAMPSNFYDAFWGVQAFGGELLDEEGRVILNQGGFANWLGWLKRAQENPNIILNRNSDTLFDLFVEGNASYYLGSSEALPALQEAMGEASVGVVRLPGIQNRAAGPFLEVNAMMFSQASATASRSAALRLAQFLTNAEQQTEFALSAGRLPVNQNVEIDPRIAPLTAEFVAQARTSVPITLANRDRIENIITLGNSVYGQVLGGETTVVAAANMLTEQVNDQFGLDTFASSVTDDCDLSGSIKVWHPYTESAETVLTQIQQTFLQACPNTFIQLEAFERTELIDLYEAALAHDDAPDMLLVTNRDITRLAASELIAPLDNALDADFLQRYALGLETTARFDGSLYGVPVALNSMALYYDTELVSDPPVVLDDILTMAADGLRFGIPIGFEESYWGIAAFGETGNSPIFDTEGRFALGDVGLTDWLIWLQEAQLHSNIILDHNREALREQFINQELALLVDDARQLPAIRLERDADAVGVVPLPSGAPLLGVDMFVFNAKSDEQARAVGVQFAKSLTDIENQRLLMAEAARIPVNINLDTAEFPLVDGFVRQSESAVTLPNDTALSIVLKMGNLIYEETIDNAFDVVNAVNAFVNVVDAANGFEIVEETVETAEGTTGCEDEGEISLWHSWDETETLAWQTVISDFVSLCPNIEIMTTFVPEPEMTQTLSETLQADSELITPDLFIGRSDHRQTYLSLNLLKVISSFVNENQMTDYQPRATRAFQQDEALYGLPQHIDTQALFYLADQVPEPAQTLNQLQEQVEAGATIGLLASLEGLIWGGSAFGCVPCLDGNFFDEQGEILLTEAALSEWFDYLNELDATGNVVFASEEAALINLFMAGELDYIVINSGRLHQLEIAVGTANLGTTGLPSGAGESVTTPYALIHGFFFSQNASDAQTALAMQFALYANGRDSQAHLFQAARYVPTHNLVIISAENPLLTPLLEQLSRVVLMPDSIARQQLNDLSTRFEALSNNESE